MGPCRAFCRRVDHGSNVQGNVRERRGQKYIIFFLLFFGVSCIISSMDLYTSIPMTQHVYSDLQRNVHHPPVLTGSSLPMTFYHKFCDGKPLAAGISIITISLVQIALGIQAFVNLVFFSVSLLTFILFWGPVFYIVTASLMISGKRKPSICLVTSSMILNIISSVISFVGLSLAAVDIYIVTERCFESFHRFDSKCSGFAGMARPCLILVSNLLLLIVSIYSAVYAGRSMKHVPSIPQAYET
ncbi:membrane-spanning 4-domains subfamily A member 8-like isoform X3 [Engystomops pustulosus]|uniref:membrane-spanning 4-domains subfamily A member 8-like isoform X3 n=1 Tax=Engystomops pustulosus TaxID=76066 RepID=UPI003AFA4756